MHEWGASLTDVGLQVQAKRLLGLTLGDEDKSLRAWLPKEDNELVGAQTNFSLTKSAFWVEECKDSRPSICIHATLPSVSRFCYEGVGVQDHTKGVVTL